jgi:NTP pyrophosphatase (non-canonical NTP hydrolase)
MDHQTTINELRTAVQQFIDDRNWDQFHSPKNLALSIAVEAAELMEHFQWSTLDEARAYVQDEAKQAEVADELADILIYCLSFANSADIDVSSAIRTKLARNETRFPTEGSIHRKSLSHQQR